MTEPRAARILICEDSRTYAAALKRFLEHDADLEVVATCPTATRAHATLLEVKPDLVIMDLELPDASGVDAIEWIMRDRPTPILVLSAHGETGSGVATEALAKGALDVVPKQDISLRTEGGAGAAMFRRRVKRLSLARVGGRRRVAAKPPTGVVRRGVQVVGIAASTGGPPALEAVLRHLPADFPIPVLVVQHIAEGFVKGLAELLDQSVATPVGMAVENRRAAPGVWFAPDGAHLRLDAGMRLRFDPEHVSGYHCPAADVLFTSLAVSAGAGAATVVLTGMGSDGAEGTGAVRAAGGLTIAQDEATSAVYGMPRAARASGAEHVLPLAAIGPTLARLAPARRPRG